MGKRIVVVSDLHCGAALGLTPPGWMSGTAWPSIRAAQRKAWKLHMGMVSRWFQPDLLVANGDTVDGMQRKSHGVGLLTADMDEQVKMAAECLNAWGAKKILVTAGTPYHTDAEGQSHERNLANLVGAGYATEHHVEINGKTFFFKHKIGSSAIPHGRHTAPARDRMWNVLNAARGAAPKADILVHSHVHYYTVTGGQGWTAFTTPSMEITSGYGELMCMNTETNWGCLVFDVSDDGKVTFEPDLADPGTWGSRSVRI